MRLAGSALGVAALAGAAAALPAVACSAPADPRGNLEQVADAETILLGRVISGSGAAGDPQDWSIVVRPLEAIKGALPQGDITFSGLALSTIDGGSALSNPFEFERAHPNAYAGACNRYLFPLGTTVLFLLDRDENGAWSSAADGAFSRWAEDVPDAAAPWVQLVRLYAVAAGLPEEDRMPFLSDEREALMARTGEPLAQLMADDIARQVMDSGEAAGTADAEGTAFEDAFRDPASESAVEASLRAMRQGAVDAGN